MPITPEARQRLAARMEARRRELRLRWQDVAEASSLSLKTLHSVRTGDAGIAPLTERGIEVGLQWEQGSVSRILGGDAPAPLLATPPLTARRRMLPAIAAALAAPGIERYMAVVKAERDNGFPPRDDQEAEIWAERSLYEDEKCISIAHLRLLADTNVGASQEQTGLRRA